MHRYSFIFLTILALFYACDHSNSSESNKEVLASIPEGAIAQIAFDTNIVDLGNINEGEQVIGWIDYWNKGEAPLIIESIKAGCGCTIPEWDKEPLRGGEKASIKVLFNSSGKRGTQNILITVKSNAENAKEELRLHAKVNN